MVRTLVLITLGATVAASSGDVLVRTQFSAFPRPPETSLDTDDNPRVSGVLPQGWEDDSGWAQVWIDYRFVDEQGTRFLRMHVKRIDQGWPQLICFPLPDAPGERLYRLSFVCRNGTGAGITFGLRQRGKPYRFYWNRTESFSEDWTPARYEFRVPANDQPMGLWFNLSSTGIFDLRNVVLERLTDADVVDEIRRQYPDGGPANLFRNTRFPLGMQTGWSIDRDTSDGDVATTGPAEGEDAPALKLVCPEEVTLRSEPFPVLYPVTDHTVAASLKGTGKWRVYVVHDGKGYATDTVTLTDDWQRWQTTFTPKMGIPFYQVRFQGTGTLMLDKLQAGPAEKCGEYISPAGAQVALALPDSFDVSSARVVFADEGRVRIQAAAFGDTAGVGVHAAVTDVYGKRTLLSSVRPGRDGRCGLDITPVIEQVPFGSYRVEAWCERGGERVSPVNELVFHRLRRPRFWGSDASRSPFGVHTNSTNRHLLMAKAIGLNWTRLHDAGLQYIGWWNLEPEEGEWRFFDREILRYRTHHIKILAELGTAPPWASHYEGSGKKGFGYFDKFFQPRDLDDYRHYVRTVCTRYKGVIDAFDVWNEPWIHAWWGVDYDTTKSGRAGYVTSEEPQEDFAEMMEAARSTARSVIPEATVLGFNTTTGGTTGDRSFSGSDWTAGVLEAGGMAHCDAIAYHAYTGGGVGFPGDSIDNGLAVAVGPIREAYDGRVPKPVWMTEGSPLIHRTGNGLYRHTVPQAGDDDVLDDADRIARYLVSLLANGVERIFLYSMHAHGDFSAQPKAWNVFTTDDGFLHPSGCAHAHCAWLLEGTAFAERVDFGSGLHAYVFAGEGRAVAAVSCGMQWSPVGLPAAEGVQWTDAFGNPLPDAADFTGRLVYATAEGEAAQDRLRELFAGK